MAIKTQITLGSVWARLKRRLELGNDDRVGRGPKKTIRNRYPVISTPVQTHITRIPSYQPQSSFISPISRHNKLGSDSYDITRNKTCHPHPVISTPVKIHINCIPAYQPRFRLISPVSHHISPGKVSYHPYPTISTTLSLRRPPGKTHWPNVVKMLNQRLRRLYNNERTWETEREI